MDLENQFNDGWQRYRFSQCFRNASSEEAFLASRAKTLLLMTFVSRSVLFTFALIMFLRDIVEARAKLFIVVRGVEMGIHFVLFCFERSAIFRVRLSPAFRDRWFGFQLAMFPVSRLFADAYYLSRIIQVVLGDQPDLEVAFSASNYGGFIIGVVCGLARIFPLRFMSQFPGDITAFVSFCIGVALNPPGALVPMYIVQHIMVFGFLIGILSYTGRLNERIQRKLFVRVAVEKTLRASAEHKAENVEGADVAAGHRHRPTSTGSNLSVSVLSSSLTNTVFGKFNGSNIKAKLSGIGKLGMEENWLVDIGELAPSSLNVLGSGGFGCVLPALYHGADVALKVCCRGTRDLPEVLATAAHELRLLRRLHHPNLVTFYGACVHIDTAELLLVLEHVHGPRLVEVASRPYKEVTFWTRLGLACDVASALSYLHSRTPPIVHGDIKGGNALAERLPTRGVRGKLLDFGLSRLLRRGSPKMGGTRVWAAPEVTKGGARPHPSTDIYSFGWVVFNLISRRHPSELPESFRAAPTRAMPPPDPGPDSAPPVAAVMQLVTACTSHSPEERPTISSLQPAMAQLYSRKKTAVDAGPEAGMNMAQCLDAVRGHMSQSENSASDVPGGDGARAPSPRREAL